MRLVFRFEGRRRGRGEKRGGKKWVMRMVMTKYDSTVYIFGVAFICFGFERGVGICMRGLQHIQKNLPSLRTAVRVC